MLPRSIKARMLLYPARVRCGGCGAPQPVGTPPWDDLCPPCRQALRAIEMGEPPAGNKSDRGPPHEGADSHAVRSGRVPERVLWLSITRPASGDHSPISCRCGRAVLGLGFYGSLTASEGTLARSTRSLVILRAQESHTHSIASRVGLTTFGVSPGRHGEVPPR